MKVFLTVLSSYLIGCFSSAYLLGKIYRKIDIRGYGSGNAGATNAIRVLGKKLGALTFVLDFAKGMVAVLLGMTIMGYNGGLLGGLFAVIGHNWPVFLGFKGGKGVATSVGALAILSFPTTLIAAIIGIILIFVTRYVSLGSITILSLVPIISSLMGKSFNKYFFITTLTLALLCIIRHKANIKRLIEGNENRIGR